MATSAATETRAVDLRRMKYHLNAAIRNLEAYESMSGKRLTALSKARLRRTAGARTQQGYRRADAPLSSS
jgi:hypothetical protein